MSCVHARVQTSLESCLLSSAELLFERACHELRACASSNKNRSRSLYKRG